MWLMPHSQGVLVVKAIEPARRALALGVDKAIAANGAAVQLYLRRAHHRNPDAIPRDVISSLERQYTAAVAAMGAAAGATAAAPGAQVPALAVNLVEIGGFLETTGLFVLAVAEVHGVHIDDLERRRTLLLAALLGNEGVDLVEKMAGRTGRHWARQVVKAIPMSKIDKINLVLGHRFVTKQGTKQGVLVLGRELPLGMGAAIGGIGNAVLARGVVRAMRRSFGEAPSTFPEGYVRLGSVPGFTHGRGDDVIEGELA
jgi:hypothetical protein